MPLKFITKSFSWESCFPKWNRHTTHHIKILDDGKHKLIKTHFLFLSPRRLKQWMAANSIYILLFWSINLAQKKTFVSYCVIGCVLSQLFCLLVTLFRCFCKFYQSSFIFNFKLNLMKTAYLGIVNSLFIIV